MPSAAMSSRALRTRTNQRKEEPISAFYNLNIDRTCIPDAEKSLVPARPRHTPVPDALALPSANILILDNGGCVPPLANSKVVSQFRSNKWFFESDY